MKITALETLRLDEFPNLLWVIVEDSEGGRGTGESFFGADATEAYIHSQAAPLLIGRDPRPVELISSELYALTRQAPGGVIRQAIAAIENALADDTVRCIVITGNGPAFCAGADIT